MILGLFTKYHKLIASGFLFLFTIETAGAARSYLNMAGDLYRIEASSGYKHNYSFFNRQVPGFDQEAMSDNNITHKGVTGNDPGNISNDKEIGNKVTPKNKEHAVMEEGPGPSQPEMQTFKSVNADNMVDLFTGDFSYNIPLLDVGGYPVGIHYNSGITMDAEASWVGLGWNINPGVINRNVRGLPDDFNGADIITKQQNIKPNRTIGGNVSKTLEIFGKAIPVGVKAGIFHNNYKGWGVEYGVSSSMSTSLFSKAELTAGLSISNNSQTGLDVSPSFGVGVRSKLISGLGLDYKVGSNYNSRTGISGLQIGLSAKFMIDGIYAYQDEEGKTQYAQGQGAGNIGSFPLGGMSFVKPSFTPGISMPYTSESYTFSLSPGEYKKFQLKTYGTLTGYTSVNSIEPEDQEQKMPAYGYLNFEKAKNAGDRVLMDFNRDKEVAFRNNTPHIAVPYYTYDLFSIAGEGIGGSFRPYRSDIGYVFDHTNNTKSKTGNFSLEVGIGGWAQVGLDVDRTDNTTSGGPWKTGNNLLAKQIEFKQEDNTTFEPVYFKNPGEFTAADEQFHNAIGDTNLVSMELVGVSGPNTADPVLNNRLVKYKNHVAQNTISLNADSYRKQREKRTQVISYLNAGLASKYALDTLIKVYDINAIPSLGCSTNFQTIKRVDDLRKIHHLSEITVLNKEGKRYVYGIPAYNKTQQEVTFAVNKDNADLTTGLVTYSPGLGDNSLSNQVGNTDRFFNKEITPAYAQSFMLSSILSADYVDVTGNGLSEDDQGDAIKFNYSRAYGNLNFYRWRAPFYEDKASYGEGLKSDRRDDRGSYTYGEKEIWYLNSVESKNMIAVFTLETDPLKIRKDMYGTKDENGGADFNQKMYYLKEINLYTKADLIKNGNTDAKPIKTVHFEYDYSLCKNHPGAINSSTGKLTLRKIWFSYNKTNKGIQSPYVFRYDQDVIDGNGNVTDNNSPSYNNKSYDRWGNYKTVSNNPGIGLNQLNNMEFPYATQNSTEANTNAAAWSLTEIKLPSGGRMKVTYEADDYGYVQNKRAAQMMEIAGFGKDSVDVPGNFLYKTTGLNTDVTSRYIFIKVPEAVSTEAMIKEKYLAGIEKLFVKFSMKVKADVWGGGSEMVTCYIDKKQISRCGIKGNPSDKIIWLKIEDLGGKNPFLLAATQFLRMNLYSKAYPNSEPGDDISIKSFLLSLGTVFGNIKNAVAGFYNYTLSEGRCREVISSRSFVRLNNPGYRKLGGGHRVKKVEIFDNWNNMTNGAQRESVYGKEYNYTTTIKQANGSDLTISSGVASYEPMVGKEENPFTIPSDPYKEEVGLLGPTNYFYVDEPLMESFYPAAMVGYSKVRVRSISQQKKSSGGLQETEFYTTKDFPTLTSYTPLIEGVNKYSFQNPKPSTLNFFNFNVKSYVTLSQGFKVELNDMNGKVKSTASYAENNLTTPVSYTKNYYRLENDVLGNRISSKVDAIKSSEGVISKDISMGKEIEIMVDLREQLSVTRNTNKQKNLLAQRIASFPFVFPLYIPFGYKKSEINRYRSAAVTKVVNMHGILDSVVVVEKGSKVSTKNIVFDAETGDVLLSRTNNEFDDPVYNFNYPAHWAYREMGSAYKNVQKVLSNQKITDGVLFDHTKESFFESGDEIILTEKEPVKTIFGFIQTQKYRTKTRKIWAIDAAKGMENHEGIYFIDADGDPVTTPNNLLSSMQILRSGKRNLLSASVGAVTCLANPVKTVGGDLKIVLDSTSRVVNVSALKFRESWRIDSTVTPIDTCYQVVDSAETFIYMQDALLLKQKVWGGEYTDRLSVYKPGNISAALHHIKASTKSKTNALKTKTAIKFDLSPIPEGAIITDARLSMPSMPLRDTTTGMAEPKTWIYNNGLDPKSVANTKAHYNSVNSTLGNGINFSRILNNWNAQTPYSTMISAPAAEASSANSGNTTGIESCEDMSQLNVKNLVQALVNNRQTSFGMLMSMNSYTVNDGSTRQTERRSRSYLSGFADNLDDYDCLGFKSGIPYIIVKYKYLRDTCHLTCKPSVRPEGTNPYKFGILGNWRMDRAYTFYHDRKESDPTTNTNIRNDGTLLSFRPYWEFETGLLSNQNADTAERWVWNSEITMLNRKGAEIENRDPLNRYNSVQYGYNKNLPVAVAQNSKARNMVFDGFEDYDYKTSYCETECESYNCLPPVYDAKMNNCDTLRAVRDSFLRYFNPPNPVMQRDINGCDTSTWVFPQIPIGTGKFYSRQSVFFDGMVGIPDSSSAAGTNQFQLGYNRSICNPTDSFTLEMRFKYFKYFTTAGSLIFIMRYEKDGVLNNISDIRIGHSPANGSVTAGGVTVSRPDLQYNFVGKFVTLKVTHGKQDSISFFVNDTLLGKVGPTVAGTKLTQSSLIPIPQFNRSIPKIDWLKYSDGYGRVMLDEQFNDCVNPALPAPDFNCQNNPSCEMGFTTFFNNYFKTKFSLPQIGALYRNCSIYTSPCGDSLPTCENYDTVVTRTAGFDRFADFTKGGGTRVSTQKHTGKYSLSVAANKTAGNIFPLVSGAEDSVLSTLSIKVDSIPQPGVYNVTPKGKGLLTRYNVFLARKRTFLSQGINPCMNENISSINIKWNPVTEYSNINKDWFAGSPQQFLPEQYCATDYFGVEWTGKLQAEYNVKYVFRLLKGDNDDALLYLNGIPLNFKQRNGEWITDSISLTSCTLYNFKLSYSHRTANAKCVLLWSNPVEPEPVVIPAANFYKPTIASSDTTGSCASLKPLIKLNTVKATSIYNPYFSPIAGTKIVVGAWVKESIPCNTGSYINSGIDINFGNSSEFYKLRPSGNIIEGWQRIEGVLTIPVGATSINVGLRSLGNVTVYFDDIRISPFNSTMKSFVYNPFNLRLMSELDENNYASFYEYDDEGTLIRVKKETIGGIKTIQETRSALLKQ